jgi:hypothetical protein
MLYGQLQDGSPVREHGQQQRDIITCSLFLRLRRQGEFIERGSIAHWLLPFPLPDCAAETAGKELKL